MTAAEQKWLQRIEDKIDGLGEKIEKQGNRVTVVETRQSECPARKWAQPSIIIATGSLAIVLVKTFFEQLRVNGGDL